MDLMNRAARVAYWQDLFNQFEQSGMTIRAFCAEKNIPEGSFFKWKKEIKPSVVDNRVPLKSTAVVPVKLVAAAQSVGSRVIQIVTPCGYVVRIDATTSPENLTMILSSIDAVAHRGVS
jgi:hypothetical protein